MPRPKNLKEIPLVPGKNIIKSDYFEIGFTGNVDTEGRIPKVGKEYAGQEVYIFIKKPKPAPKIRLTGCINPAKLTKKCACVCCKYRFTGPEENKCGIFDKSKILRVFYES